MPSIGCGVQGSKFNRWGLGDLVRGKDVRSVRELDLVGSQGLGYMVWGVGFKI